MTIAEKREIIGEHCTYTDCKDCVLRGDETSPCTIYTAWMCSDDTVSKWFTKLFGDEQPETATVSERANILDAAKKCVCADRDIQYGNPENSFAEIAKLWSAYLDKEITAHDVAIMMCVFKIARIKTGHFKQDNYVDVAGYIACAGEIASKSTDG